MYFFLSFVVVLLSFTCKLYFRSGKRRWEGKNFYLIFWWYHTGFGKIYCEIFKCFILNVFCALEIVRMRLILEVKLLKSIYLQSLRQNFTWSKLKRPFLCVWRCHRQESASATIIRCWGTSVPLQGLCLHLWPRYSSYPPPTVNGSASCLRSCMRSSWPIPGIWYGILHFQVHIDDVFETWRSILIGMHQAMW